MALKIKSIFCSTVMLWLNRETTFFAAFSPSTLTSYHTPSQTNAYTFCIHNSTFTPLLMEYIICTLLGIIYCTTLRRVLYTPKWLWGLFSLYFTFLVCILFTFLSFNPHFVWLQCTSITCPCKCFSLPHFYTCMHISDACLGMFPNGMMVSFAALPQRQELYIHILNYTSYYICT